MGLTRQGQPIDNVDGMIELFIHIHTISDIKKQ